MPTFTAIALDSLLEQGSRAPKPPPPVKVERPASSSASNKKVPPRLYLNISPALYATPEATSVPSSPSSFPPSSPYIVNHKRRGPRLLKSLSQNDVGGAADQLPVIGASPQVDLVNDDRAHAAATALPVSASAGELSAGEALAVEGVTDVAAEVVHKLGAAGDGQDHGVAGELQGSERSVCVKPDRDAGAEDFFDPQDSHSIGSNSDFGDGHPLSWGKHGTPLSEYYDAFEELSSNYSARSSRRIGEDELHELRTNLLMEMEKRKQTEEALEYLQARWQMLSHHLSLVGLSLPAPPAVTDEMDEHSQSSTDPVEDLCQQIVVTRSVADAVGRACSRAEVEMEMQPQIQSKNFEISRLWDRLHYYEAANKEMSQRNQQAIEMARQQRNKRKKMQRWLWSSVGLAITIGAASIAWSYMPASVSSSCDSYSAEGIHNESSN